MFRFEYAGRKHTRTFKVTCPSCKAKNRFNLFYDNELQQLAPQEFGKCDRVNKCGYENRPDGQVFLPVGNNEKTKPINVFSKDIVKRSLKTRGKDVLSKFILERYGDVGKQVLQDYIVTSVKFCDNYAPLFWYVDEWGNVRSGKIMNYTLHNGLPYRTKYEDARYNFRWLHSSVEDYNYAQIAFGSHLLKKYPEKDVALVESEKSALIMACEKPEYIWLGTLAYTGFQDYLLPNMRDRNLLVFPDKGQKTFDYWSVKTKEFLAENLVKSGKVSTFVEEQEELGEGDDICDYVLLKR